MKFMICRTNLNENKKPIDEAYIGNYQVVDIRAVSKPEDIKAYRGNKMVAIKDWYGFGINHRLINNQIARDIKIAKCWYIDINSLEDLLKLKNKYGKLIIKDCNNRCDGIMQIEIYDDYRE